MNRMYKFQNVLLRKKEMVKKKSKKLKPVDHTKLDAWKKELISKQTHTPTKTVNQTNRVL